MNNSTSNLTQGFSDGQYVVHRGAGNTITMCYFENITNDKAFWKSENSLISSLPYFVIQLSLMMLCIRLLFVILKPLRQPRFLAELLSAVLVFPLATTNIGFFQKYIHPAKSTKTLDTMGQLGLVYYMFLVGLEMDLTMLKHVERKALYNAAITTLLPLTMGIGLFFLLVHYKTDTIVGMGGGVWALTLTVTSFSDLARILSDMKLLHTDIGRLALSSAIICDLVAWAILVLAITMVNQKLYFLNVFAMILFVFLCWFVVRPILAWIIRINNSSNGGMDYELLIYFILGGVVIFGLITDACGSQSMIGAFMFGLIIPKGELGMRLIEKLEDLVIGILLPAFYWTNGLKINLGHLNNGVSVFVVAVVIILGCSAKVISAFIFSVFHGLSTREGLTLGVLMNTKGVLALIVMNVGRDLKGFDEQMFGMMTISLILMTIMVKPIAMAATKSTKHVKQYKRRTIERSKQDAELRILTCIHSVSNLSGIINLLEVSNPTKQSPICVFALHLVQLTARRVSAMLIVHDAYHRTVNSGQENQSREVEESEHIITAFQSYESRSTAVSVQALTVVSPYTSMQEDVCRLAEDKRVNLILVPFHKQPDVYGKLQDDEDVSLRAVNQNLLASAPCSIGILIDRGLGESQVQNNYVMLFIGGPDSREALAYAWRMAGTTGVRLTVIRFLPATCPDENAAEEEKERKLDDEYINDFRFRTMYDQAITFAEMQVNSGNEIVTTMRRMHDGYDLYIVGKGQGALPQLTLGLLEWSDCEELGALGDTLLSSDFAENSSILVIQQHYIPGATDGPLKTNGSHKFHHHKNMNWLSPTHHAPDTFKSLT
ncbi:cation/H(+) antiporter 15-like [Mercurialis annua]|uniref:cation/H(+) antiporter 15-like n=1 Tax=Mercurialis annua TaxID=3986 RepID=UPI0021609A3F|nr:cation/H(+) antiporter 15-like [Mercurialis annua]